MTLKAHRTGYVSIQPNMSGGMFFTGMTMPSLQVGDTVRAGMAVVQIPDLSNWDASARIGELDRGHLAVGEKAEIAVIAVPGNKYTGHIKDIGGTSGPPWDRHFDCKVTIDNPTPELRPGMTARVVLTTDMMRDVLWVPAQAVLESDGRSFVYLSIRGRLRARRRQGGAPQREPGGPHRPEARRAGCHGESRPAEQEGGPPAARYRPFPNDDGF